MKLSPQSFLAEVKSKLKAGWLLLLILVGLVLLLGTLFLNQGNRSFSIWLSALALGLCFSFVGLGVYLSFRVMDYPDLTIDGTLPLGAAISAVLIIKGMNPYLTIIPAMTAGAIAGAVTAMIATRLKIHSLLASILTTTSLFTINLRIMGQSNIPLINEKTIFSLHMTKFIQLLEQFNVGSMLISARIILAIIVFGAFALLTKLVLDWFLHTEFGLALRATGDNPQMIRSLGVNTDWMYIIGLAISNALVSLAGALLAQFQGFSDVNIGQGLIIAGLAAVIIGETIFRPGSIRAATAAAITGMVVYRFVIAGALSLAVPLPGGNALRIQAQDVKLATAALVLIFLWFTNRRSSIR